MQSAEDELQVGHIADLSDSYVGLIGDLVKSREIADRAHAQQDLQEVLRGLTERHSASIAAGFQITAGDEFQVLLKDGSAVVDLIWEIEEKFLENGVRFGVGRGAITTAMVADVRRTDGPAWYAARDAIIRAKKEEMLGGVFQGFGYIEDQILNGLARLLGWHRHRLPREQRRVVGFLRQGKAQFEIAAELNSTKQNINKLVRRSGWKAYSEGERALFALLSTP